MKASPTLWNSLPKELRAITKRGERCVTSQKTAARETKLKRDKHYSVISLFTQSPGTFQNYLINFISILHVVNLDASKICTAQDVKNCILPNAGKALSFSFVKKNTL